VPRATNTYYVCHACCCCLPFSAAYTTAFHHCTPAHYPPSTSLLLFSNTSIRRHSPYPFLLHNGVRRRGRDGIATFDGRGSVPYTCTVFFAAYVACCLWFAHYRLRRRLSPRLRPQAYQPAFLLLKRWRMLHGMTTSVLVCVGGLGAGGRWVFLWNAFSMAGTASSGRMAGWHPAWLTLHDVVTKRACTSSLPSPPACPLLPPAIRAMARALAPSASAARMRRRAITQARRSLAPFRGGGGRQKPLDLRGRLRTLLHASRGGRHSVPHIVVPAMPSTLLSEGLLVEER